MSIDARQREDHAEFLKKQVEEIERRQQATPNPNHEFLIVKIGSGGIVVVDTAKDAKMAEHKASGMAQTSVGTQFFVFKREAGFKAEISVVKVL